MITVLGGGAGDWPPVERFSFLEQAQPVSDHLAGGLVAV
jgi:hypothetical protein